MSIQFTPLWETVRRQNLTTYSLIQMGFSKGTLHRLKHNQLVSTRTINTLLELLRCQPNDIMVWIPDSEVPSCISSESQT